MHHPTYCPFCNGGARDNIFAESADFYALYNVAPILPGHSLVIPKNHVESLFDLSEVQARELIPFSTRVTRLLLHAFQSQGFNWSIQEREEAGQTVSHLHLHIIPRRRFDLPHPGDWFPRLRQSESELIDSSSRARLTDREIKEVVSYLRSFALDQF